MTGDEQRTRQRFVALYEANYEHVARYARRRTATVEDAMDVVAETFLVAWRRCEELPTGEQTKLWLFGTARRVLANQRRSQHRRERLAQRLRTEPRAQSAEPGEGQIELELAKSALWRLSPEQRDLLGLVAWEGLSIVELAQTLGCSKNAAKIRLHRARRRFTAELHRSESEAKLRGSAGHGSHQKTHSLPSPGETS
ncbi:MAG TPA: RNA polymerase sigma factor [Solirubrobacteraceae bacterium]